MLLGQPTEIYSKRDSARVYAPMRQATALTGKVAANKSEALKNLATLHRAPDIKAEDRWLVVITCSSAEIKKAHSIE